MNVISFQDIKAHLNYPEVIERVEHAFVRYSRAEINTATPPVLHLELRDRHGAFHVRAGHARGARLAMVKVASTFFDNPQKGMPSISSVFALFDAENGLPAFLLDDQGLITNMRTGAAGAVAVRHLANPGPQRTAFVGTGTQARFQLAATAAVAEIAEVRVFGRHFDELTRQKGACPNCSTFLNFVHEVVPSARVVPCTSIAEAAAQATVIFTATPVADPLLRWVDVPRGALVIGLGADSTHKQELEPDIILKADRVIVDSREQNKQLAEISKVMAEWHVDESVMDAELGQVCAGAAVGRSQTDEIIVCKLTGLAAQDIAVCELIVAKHSAGERKA